MTAGVHTGARTITVRRSFDDPTTKTDEEATIPIAGPLAPYLQDAIERSRSDLVFPGKDGRMRTEEADPEKVLRRALGRADFAAKGVAPRAHM